MARSSSWKPSGLDQMKHGVAGRAETGHGAGVRRDFRFHEDDLEVVHGRRLNLDRIMGFGGLGKGGNSQTGLSLILFCPSIPQSFKSYNPIFLRNEAVFGDGVGFAIDDVHQVKAAGGRGFGRGGTFAGSED